MWFGVVVMVMRPVQVFAFLLLLSSLAWAGRVAIVADSGSSVMTACVSYSGTKTAADILSSSGLGVEMADYGGALGKAVCMIGGTGCSASNCFCQSNSWAFFYSAGGSWAFSWTEGVSSHQVSDGEIIGFRWTSWPGWVPEEPAWRDFESICSSSGAREGPRVIRHFSVNITNADGVQGGQFCLGAPIGMNIQSAEDKSPVWDPTFNDAKREVFSGSMVKVFRKDGWWDVADGGYTDKGGNYSFTPLLAGNYSVEISKSGFVHEYADLVVRDCTPVPQCSLNSDCNYDETCDSGTCTPVSGFCGIAENHKFIEYACCSDSMCSANSRCEDHLCVNENRAHIAEVMRVLFNIYYIS